VIQIIFTQLIPQHRSLEVGRKLPACAGLQFTAGMNIYDDCKDDRCNAIEDQNDQSHDHQTKGPSERHHSR